MASKAWYGVSDLSVYLCWGTQENQLCKTSPSENGACPTLLILAGHTPGCRTPSYLANHQARSLGGERVCVIGRTGLTLARKTSGHVGQESDTLSSSLAPPPHTPSFFRCRVGIVVMHSGLSRAHVEMCTSSCFIRHLGLQTLKELCLPIEGILTFCSGHDPIDPTDLGGAQMSLLGTPGFVLNTRATSGKGHLSWSHQTLRCSHELQKVHWVSRHATHLIHRISFLSPMPLWGRSWRTER